jgi:hypothetical protein
MNASPQKKKELQKETIVPDSMINLLPKRIDTAEVRLQP